MLLAACVALAGCVHEPRTAHAPAAAMDAERLGTVHFPVSCGAAVQPEFDHAVALLHHMTYPQARAAFRAIAAAHPGCAMAHWGVAMTMFQPLWPTRPGPAELQTGWDELAIAQAAPGTDAREHGFIEAAQAFFRDPQSPDYWARVDRWDKAMAEVHADYPDDPEASAFYALALLASARPGPEAVVHAKAALALLRPVLARNPDHPGAMHYIVHADDLPGLERDDLDIVRAYERAAPENAHALHMPTHIYTRLGDWDAVIAGNLRAKAAALKHPSGEHGEFVSDEYPHAVEYLVYAYLQRGEDDAAQSEIARLVATPALEPTAKTAFHLASTRARYALERRDWAAAAAIAPRDPAWLQWDKFPWPEAVACFAHGYGALRQGDRDEARRAEERIEALAARASAAGEENFVRQIRILGLDLAGESAHADGDDAKARALLEQAAALEAATPKPAVTPAPTLPAPELLGDLLRETGHASEAAAAYREALSRYPRRFNATLGLARALAAAGDRAGARSAYASLLEIAPNATRDAASTEAKAFLASE